MKKPLKLWVYLTLLVILSAVKVTVVSAQSSLVWDSAAQQVYDYVEKMGDKVPDAESMFIFPFVNQNNEIASILIFPSEHDKALEKIIMLFDSSSNFVALSSNPDPESKGFGELQGEEVTHFKNFLKWFNQNKPKKPTPLCDSKDSTSVKLTALSNRIKVEGEKYVFPTLLDFPEKWQSPDYSIGTELTSLSLLGAGGDVTLCYEEWSCCKPKMKEQTSLPHSALLESRQQHLHLVFPKEYPWEMGEYTDEITGKKRKVDEQLINQFLLIAQTIP